MAVETRLASAPAITMSLREVISRIALINVLVVLGYVAYEASLRNSPYKFIVLFTFLPYTFLKLIIPENRRAVQAWWRYGHTIAIRLAVLQLIYWAAFWAGLRGGAAGVVLAILTLEVVMIPIASFILYNEKINKPVIFSILSIILISGVLLTKLQGQIVDIVPLLEGLKDSVADGNDWPLLLVVIALLARVYTEVYKGRILDTTSKLYYAKHAPQLEIYGVDGLVAMYYTICSIFAFLFFALSSDWGFSGVGWQQFAAMFYISLAPAGIQAIAVAKLQKANVPGTVIFSCMASRPIIFVMISLILYITLPLIGKSELADKFLIDSHLDYETVRVGIIVITIAMFGYLAYYVALFRERRKTG